MNARTILLGAVATLALPALLPAANIDRATITEVVNSVNVIDAGTKRSSPAHTSQLFTAPNLLRTGADSRAEMVAPDATVTRVGQNSLFSFEPNSREVDLQKGSVLFQSPSGKGGGTIRTPAASAAVLGTTLIVTTTKNGGFKVLLVEGRGSVKTSTGKTAKLNAGQMVYALPGGALSNVFEFRLSQQVAASRLLAGFKKPIPSVGKIQAAVQKQEKEIAQGKAIASNLLATDSPNIAIRVDVARDTDVKQQTVVTSPVAATAAILGSDAIIDQPALDDQRLFPNATADTGLVGQTFRAAEDDSDAAFGIAANPLFFIGQDVTFDTPTVDLSPFAGNDLLRFLAVKDLKFNQSVDLGDFPGGDLQFVAGHTILSLPGVRVTMNAPNASFLSLGSKFPLDGDGVLTEQDFSPLVPVVLDDFGAINHGGSLLFFAGELKFTDVQLAASGNLAVIGRRDVALGSTRSGDLQETLAFLANGPYQPSSGFGSRFSGLASASQVRVAAGRDLDIVRTAIASPSTTLQAGRTVRLTAVRIDDGRAQLPNALDSSNGVVIDTSPRSLTITSQLLADLRGVNLVANDVRIESNTVRLEAVQFRDGSRVVLESRLGLLAPQPNSNRPVLAGYVNFVRGVRYGNQPAEDAVVSNTPRGQGIIIRNRNGVSPSNP